MSEIVDALVIGGGLVGCAAAWHLARAGCAVLLVERGDLNSGASGQNAGSLHFQMERRFLEQGGDVADQVSGAIALNRLAITEWRTIEGELGQDLEVVMNGGLMVAESAAELALLEAKARFEARWALPTRLIDGDEARRIAPYLSSRIVGASYMEEEGHANPRIVTSAFAAAALAAGAKLSTYTAVTGLHWQGGVFHMEGRGADGPIVVRARKILIAAGAWTALIGSMLNLHLPVYPAGLTMNITERVAPLIPHLVQHAGRRLSMKQAISGNILIGGGWASRLAQSRGGGFDLSQPPRLIEESVIGNLRAAADTVPLIANMNLVRSWTGVVAITADQLPLVGEISRMPGLFVVAGGSGFTLGPLFARAVSSMLRDADAGEAGELLRIFSPARFEHINSFMG